jgi:polar amino acid transport system substrate-binding protein
MKTDLQKVKLKGIRSSNFFLLAIVIIMGSCFDAMAGEIKIRALTSSFPPLQMLKNGQPVGYAVNTITALVQKINLQDRELITLDFEFLPWKRGLRIATSDQPNILFFSLSRSPPREDQFHWVGQISRYDSHLYTLDEKLLKTETTLDAIRLSQRIIGVQDGSSAEEYLLSSSFIKGTDYITFADYHEGIRMLYRHRLDYIPMTSFLARGNVCGEKLDPDLLIKSIRLDKVSQPLWVVFSKATSPELVQRFSEALVYFNESSEYKRNIQLQTNIWTDHVCEKENI